MRGHWKGTTRVYVDKHGVEWGVSRAGALTPWRAMPVKQDPPPYGMSPGRAIVAASDVPSVNFTDGDREVLAERIDAFVDAADIAAASAESESDNGGALILALLLLAALAKGRRR